MHSAKNYVIAGLLIATGISAALAWRQHLELVAFRAAALEPDERAEWEQRVATAEKRRAELEQQLAATAPVAESEPAELPAPPVEPGQIVSVRPAGRGAGGGRYAAVMEQPEVQRLLALQHKASLDGRYAALFRRLALSPAQLDQFKNLLVEKTTAAIDVMSAARQQGLNPRRDRAAVDQLLGEANAEIDADIRALLGETGYTQFQQYERTAPQRAVVGQLEQRLSYSTTPLSPNQSEQLTRILAANTATTPSGARGGGGPFGGRQPAITDTAINQALGVLAAPQVEALRQLQQEQQAQAELAAAFRNQGRTTTRQPAATTPPAGTPPPPPPASGG